MNKTPSFWKVNTDGKTCRITPMDDGTITTLNQAQKFTPEGAYTTFRTYDHYKVLNLTRHFNRLDETVALSGGHFLVQREMTKQLVSDCLSLQPETELRVRISIDLTDHPYDLYLAFEPLKVPSKSDFQNGVNVAIAAAKRDNPRAKLNRFLSTAEEIRTGYSNENEEVIMHNERNELTEGLSSNFFAVRNGTLITAEQGVLMGTTRAYVLDLAKELDIRLIKEPVKIEEIPTFEEAFITSTSRSILPIRRIDAFELPGNVPGVITRRLMAHFEQELEKHLEDLRS